MKKEVGELSSNMEKPFEKIRALLDERDIDYTLLEHEHIHTSEDAARVRGTSMSEGAKSLLLKMEDEFVLVVIPGDKRLSIKKLRHYLNIGRGRFAHPQEVVETMGCEVGSCYPIGSVASLRTIVDPSFESNDHISFNPGVHTKSIDMRWSDYKALGDWEYVDVTED